jgi:hypothetical protein
MILYNLKCSQDHNFEAWFKDSGTYDKQAKRKHIECPVCSDTAIEKAIMAPRLSSTTRKKGLEYEVSTTETNGNKLKPRIDKTRAARVAREMLEITHKLQKHVEENCENVGKNFAEEARAIHYGETKERGIYGEATPSEVKDLVDEDIPISSIPWKKNKPSQ